MSLNLPDRLSLTTPEMSTLKSKLGLKSASLKTTCPPEPMLADSVSEMPRLKFATASSPETAHPRNGTQKNS